MKWIKKILRIIAIILPAYCIFFIPGDTYATTYMIDSFNAHGYYFGDYYLQEPPQIWITSSLASNPDFKPRNFASLTSKLEDARCVYYSYNTPGYSITGRTVTFGSAFYLDNTFSPSSGNNACRKFGEYGVNMPTFNTASIPIDKQANVLSILPHNYMFSTTPFNGSRDKDGVIYSGRLSLMSYLNQYFGSAEDSSDSDQNNANNRDWVADATAVSGFKLPINFYVEEDIDSISLTGSISFLPTDSQKSTYGSVGYLTPDFLTHGHIKISYRYMYWNDNDHLTFNGTELLSDDCQYSLSNSLLNLTYVCSFSLPHTAIDYYGSIGMSLYFTTDNDNSYLMFNSQDVAFNEIRITTNGLDSPVILGSRSDDGSFPNVAPGMPDVNDSYANWLESLLSLFTFTLTNPFAPLFNLFTSGDQCASIPIIAGMLHAPESTYCPWFDATTRNIVTPVVALSSMMLIFGFIVKWLGSDSGNMFADGPNQHINIKGGK